MLGTLLSSAVSWTPGVHTLGWCRAPVLRTASLLLSANSASMGGDEVQPVSLDGFFSFFNTLSAPAPLAAFEPCGSVRRRWPRGCNATVP